MDLIVFPLLMLSGFGATVFASVGADRGRWLALALGFAAVIFWNYHGQPLDTAWIGGLSALAAVAHLVVPGRGWMATAVGGALAAIFQVVLQAQGLPPAAAWTAAVTPPVAACWLAARRGDFAPQALREEALLMVLGVALLVAVTPGVAAGWRSAVALNATADRGGSDLALPAWALSLSGSAAAAGGLASLWRHR